eukprot:scaffold186714_cov22-Tisochrysis_lutea.AAC.1
MPSIVGWVDLQRFDWQAIPGAYGEDPTVIRHIQRHTGCTSQWAPGAATCAHSQFQHLHPVLGDNVGHGLDCLLQLLRLYQSIDSLVHSIGVLV